MDIKKYRVLCISVLTSASLTQAAVIQHIGEYSGWGSVQWQALGGLDDIDNGVAEELDFVGNTTDHAAYWGLDSDYVYFRMRLDVDAAGASTFSGSHHVLIDLVGYSSDDGRPDFGFAWDSKSNDPSSHGLEMMVLDTLGTTWETTKMDDFDGDNGKKLTTDINGANRETDGYVQTSDGISTDAFGDTTFLDFAVSLTYLSSNVSALIQNPNWRIQLASVDNATDHNAFTEDLAGNVSPSDTISSDAWSTAIAIPEPMVSSLVCIFAGGMLFIKRLFHS